MTTQNTQTTQPAAPQRGTPEYTAAMVARAERGFASEQEAATLALQQQQQQEQQEPQRPAWAPEKFWNPETGQVDVEKLAKSYAELEKMRGKQQPEQPPQTQQQQEQQPAEKAEQSAKDAVEQAGLDWNDLKTKVEAEGDISDDARKALNKIGIPDDIIDAHLQMMAASREFAVMRTAEYVGGKQNLDAIMQRAGAELAADEIASYNKLLSGPEWRVAMDALKARFLPGNTDSTFDGGDFFSGVPTTGQTSGGVPFASRREQNEAINKRDERGRRLYDIDPAYRQMIRQRMTLTNFG